MKSDDEFELELCLTADDVRAMKHAREASRSVPDSAFELLLQSQVEQRPRKTFEGYEPFEL